jgi:predicted deacetylase
MTLEQQRDILDHTYKLLTDFNHGVPPKGSVAPWWETSKEGTALLLEKGIEYGQDISPFHSSKILTLSQQITPICATSKLV